MEIAFKIHKVKDVYDKVLKVTCKLYLLLVNYEKCYNKSVKSIINDMESTKVCSTISPSKYPHHQKLAN